MGNKFPCIICNTVQAMFSNTPCSECDELLDSTFAALRIARMEGVPKYGPSSWHEVTTDDNLEHALTHIFKYKRGDTTEDHIAHAICRLVMEYARHANS